LQGCSVIEQRFQSLFPLYSLRGNHDNAAHSNGKQSTDSKFACDRPHDSVQFYEFCLANRDLRIERTADGDVVIMPPAFADTGNRNIKIAQQLANWADQDGTGEAFDSSAGFTLPMARPALLMLPGSG
jgi:hypothetical protein